MAFDLRLIDAARVVVEAARDLQIGDDGTRHPLVRGVEQLGQLTQPLLEQLTAHAEVGQAIADLSRIGRADLRHLQQDSGLIAIDAGLGELGSHTLRTDLVNLVEAAQRRLNVGDAQRLAHALDNLAIVDEHAHGWDR